MAKGLPPGIEEIVQGLENYLKSDNISALPEIMGYMVISGFLSAYIKKLSNIVIEGDDVYYDALEEIPKPFSETFADLVSNSVTGFPDKVKDKVEKDQRCLESLKKDLSQVGMIHPQALKQVVFKLLCSVLPKPIHKVGELLDAATYTMIGESAKLGREIGAALVDVVDSAIGQYYGEGAAALKARQDTVKNAANMLGGILLCRSIYSTFSPMGMYDTFIKSMKHGIDCFGQGIQVGSVLSNESKSMITRENFSLSTDVNAKLNKMADDYYRTINTTQGTTEYLGGQAAVVGDMKALREQTFHGTLEEIAAQAGGNKTVMSLFTKVESAKSLAKRVLAYAAFQVGVMVGCAKNKVINDVVDLAEKQISQQRQI